MLHLPCLRLDSPGFSRKVYLEIIIWTFQTQTILCLHLTFHFQVTVVYYSIRISILLWKTGTILLLTCRPYRWVPRVNSKNDFSREICHLSNVSNRSSSPVGPEEETTWLSTRWIIAAECDDQIVFTTELKSWETSLYMSVLKHMDGIRASAVIKHVRRTDSHSQLLFES